MPFKSVLGTGIGTGSGTTIVITLANPIAVGDLVVVRVAADNLSASTPTFTCVDSSGTNVYTKRREAARNATAAAGIAGCFFTCKATAAVTNLGGTITVTLSGAVSARVADAECHTGVNDTIRSTMVGGNGATAALTTTVSGAVAVGDLVLTYAAIETRASFTGDADTLGGAWSTLVRAANTASGSDTSAVTVAGQHKYATTTDPQTWDLTVAATDWVCGLVVLQGTPPPPMATGTATIGHGWTAGAAGARTPVGAASFAYAEAVLASGAAPAVAPPGTRLLEDGTTGRTTEAGDFRALEGAPTAPPKEGSASSSHLWLPTAVGAKAQSGTATTGHTWTVTAAGVKPAVGVKQGIAAVAWNEATTATGTRAPKATAATQWASTGSAAGKRTPKAAGVAGHSWGLTAAGKRTARATATLSHSWAPTTAGNRTPKATATTGHSWTVTAQGAKPTVGAKQGSATASHTWTTTTAGKRTPKGAPVVSHLWATTAAGKRIAKGSATTAHAWPTVAAGKRTPKATGLTAHLWATGAVGKRAPKATATAVHSWLVTAIGFRPIVGGKVGSATLTWTEATAAVGKRVPKAGANVSHLWVPSALGRTTRRGAAGTVHVWIASAAGKRAVAGTGLVTYRYVLTATGKVVVIGFLGQWNGEDVLALQWGDAEVVDWLLMEPV